MIGVAILIGLVVIVVVIVLIIYFIFIYNSLIRLRTALDKAWLSIDLLLKQRYDELPKLIETCKSYRQHEQKTVKAVTEARAAYARATTPGEKAQANNLLTGALRSLFAEAEKYPELKANTHFKQLRRRITELETNIAAQGVTFNQDASVFNLRITQASARLVASFMNLYPNPLFEAAPDARRNEQEKLT